MVLTKTTFPKVSHIIWLAAAWCIWLERNDIIFRGKILNILEVVDRIKRLSWSWFICREGGNKNFVFSMVD
jgi:hypothetical protein